MQFWPLLGVFALFNFIFLLFVAAYTDADRKFTGALLASGLIDIVFVVAWFTTRWILSL